MSLLSQGGSGFSSAVQSLSMLADAHAFARKPPMFSFESGFPLELVDIWLALDAALVLSNSKWVSISNALHSEHGISQSAIFALLE